MGKYLDSDGLTEIITKMKRYVDDRIGNNDPETSGPITVEQILTSGTEIAKINGTSLFAPEETHSSFSMQTHTKSGVTAASGAMTEGTFNVTGPAGYYPYGIVGFLLANGSGSGSSYAIFNNMRISNRATGRCTINWRIRAYGGKINNCTIYVDTLWVKA